jgi:pentatricopeptide repeat protein
MGAPPKEVRQKEMAAAGKALELDPDIAEAHVIVASLHQTDWQWAEAQTEYRRALDLNPNDPAAYDGFSFWLLCQGRLDESLSWARRARELDPVGLTSVGESWIYFMARRYDEAIRNLKGAIAQDPNRADAQWFLGFALIGNGQFQQAIPVLQKTLSLTHGSSAVMGVLIHAYAHAGHRHEALRLLDELKRRSKSGYVPAGAFVNAYVGLDDREQAFFWLDRAYQEHSNIVQFLKVHPYFDPIRNDPRYTDLVHRVGLDKSY